MTRSIDFTIDCPIPSEAVFAAMTDFSDRRPAYYPNLSRKRYRVLDLKEHSARVQEGAGPFLTVERYEWSGRCRVWSVIEESNVFRPGGVSDVKISDRRDGGSRLQVHLEREFHGWRGGVLQLSLAVNGRSGFFRRTYIKMLRNVARELR